MASVLEAKEHLRVAPLVYQDGSLSAELTDLVAAGLSQNPEESFPPQKAKPRLKIRLKGWGLARIEQREFLVMRTLNDLIKKEKNL